MTQNGRGSGRTTRQMLEAKDRAVFVWCSHHVNDAKAIAAKIGRNDLKIRPISILNDNNVYALRGLKLDMIVFDHAVVDKATHEQLRNMILIEKTHAVY